MLDWFTTDPVGLSLFGFVRNLVYLLVVLFILNHVVDHMFTKMNREMGIKPDENIWAELEKGNLAAAVYFGFRVAAVLIAGGLIVAGFIK